MNYGELNGHSIGIILKELVRRAIVTIRAERFSFGRTVKMGQTGQMDDLVTSADQCAQTLYLRGLQECFPGWGIMAEEDDCKVVCTHPSGLRITVDPLDGTKAFGRRQSHGVGTMIALIQGDEVIAAYVGDVNTLEIYGFRPGSDKVHRISDFEANENLVINPERLLSDQSVLMRNRPEEYSATMQALVRHPKNDGHFKDMQITDGSIGISMARLWKGEVGAMVFEPKKITPWDDSPLIGISQKMGFVWVKIDPTTGALSVLRPRLVDTVYHREYEVLVVHQSRLQELGL